MSGRGLGHTGGTLDKLESIPGFRTELTLDEYVAQVRDVGVAIIGQTGDLVPADKLLYGLRDVTATVDERSLIAASIMSKKLAGGAQAIVLDVKVGNGAFMKSIEDARELAETMIELGEQAGREVVCLLTDMDQPLGAAVGNALEVREALDTVRGHGPARLHRARARRLRASCSRSPTSGSTRRRAAAVPRRPSPTAARRSTWRRWIEAQGGTADESALPTAPVVHELTAPVAGYVSKLGAIDVGNAAVHLGAGRRTKDDQIDHAVGIVVHAKRGDLVEAGQTLAEIHARTESEATVRRRRGACCLRDLGRRARRAAGAARGRRLTESARYGGPVPELPEVETRPPWARACAGRPSLRARRDHRSTAHASARSGRGRAGARGRARDEGRSPRQVFDCSVRVGSRASDPPPDDGVAAARERWRHARRTIPTGVPLSTLDDGSDVAYRDVRRFGTWLLLEPDEVEHVHRRSASGASRSTPRTRRSTSRRSSRRGARRSRRRSSTSARSRASGTSTPTRRSGARSVHPLTPANELDRRRGEGAAPRRSARRSSAGIAAAGLDAARLPAARRRRAATCRTSSRSTAAAGEPCERCGTPIDKIRVAGRGTWYCPTLPARADERAPLRGEQLVEPALALEAPELGVAADRPAVDQDLRHGPAAGQVVQLRAERRVVVEVDLLVLEAARVEQRLRAHAVAAPAWSYTSESWPSRLTTQKRRTGIPRSRL